MNCIYLSWVIDINVSSFHPYKRQISMLRFITFKYLWVPRVKQWMNAGKALLKEDYESLYYIWKTRYQLCMHVLVFSMIWCFRNNIFNALLEVVHVYSLEMFLRCAIWPMGLFFFTCNVWQNNNTLYIVLQCTQLKNKMYYINCSGKFIYKKRLITSITHFKLSYAFKFLTLCTSYNTNVSVGFYTFMYISGDQDGLSKWKKNGQKRV